MKKEIIRILVFLGLLLILMSNRYTMTLLVFICIIGFTTPKKKYFTKFINYLTDKIHSTFNFI
jgi:hypothetical protein